MGDEIYDHEKTRSLIKEITRVSYLLGCNLLETAKACEAVHASYTAQMKLNAESVLESMEDVTSE